MPTRTSARRVSTLGHKISRTFSLLMILLLVIVVGTLGAGIYIDTQLTRIDALVPYEGQVGATAGTNWLLVGSDSRNNLSEEEQAELATGGDTGPERTDTIILVHLPRSGAATIISIPRDSFVSIPGQGRDKINAAFGSGGPQLLVQTIEGASGLHIDHYAEIGFGGFADMVDAIGGLDMCLTDPLDDPLAGVTLDAGCQELNGAQALGYVRSRNFPQADLKRMEHQREFMSALMNKASSAWTVLNPFRTWGLATAVSSSLKVDSGDHVWHLARLALALRGAPIQTTVPIGSFEDTGVGNVVRWDRELAAQFFELLAQDEPLPPELITTVPQ